MPNAKITLSKNLEQTANVKASFGERNCLLQFSKEINFLFLSYLKINQKDFCISINFGGSFQRVTFTGEAGGLYYRVSAIQRGGAYWSPIATFI